MSQTFLVVASGAFGACVGSFLNVVIHRLPQEDPQKRSLLGRSRCPRCGVQIRWSDNVPLLSYALLAGRSRCCREPISRGYPAVEALTAVLFALVAAFGPFVPLWQDQTLVWSNALGFLFQAAFVAMLVACTFIDLDHRILPDAITLPGIATGLVGAFLVPGLAGSFPGRVSPELSSLMYSGAGVGTGVAVTWLVRAVAGRIFKREAMGLGDVKFLGMIGAFVGWKGALLTFFLASIVGAIGGLVHRWLTRDAYVPFGPFLAIGALLAMFLEEPILVLLFETWPRWQQESPMAPWMLTAAALLSIIALVILVRRGRGK